MFLNNNFVGIIAFDMAIHCPEILAKALADNVFFFNANLMSWRNLVILFWGIFIQTIPSSLSVEISYPIYSLEVVGSKLDFSKLTVIPNFCSVSSKTILCFSIHVSVAARIKSSTYTDTRIPFNRKNVMIGLSVLQKKYGLTEQPNGNLHHLYFCPSNENPKYCCDCSETGIW